MHRPFKHLLLSLLAAFAASSAFAGPQAGEVRLKPVNLQATTRPAKPLQITRPARKQTVCTITVNSPDEKEVFRRFLPESKYNFVELVEKGRSDWLASSCRAATSCDVLIVSGHFDGDNEFFSDQVESHDMLAVAELERASCSNSCPSLFSNLKEVYLFGCNTLNHRQQGSVSADTVRDYVRDGRVPGAAEARLQAINVSHGQSSMERMRLLFRDVPVLYGFAATAPLGPVAAGTLTRHFQSRGASVVGTGRLDPALVQAFSGFSMASARGIREGDARMSARRDMCQFADDRLSTADKLGFAHTVLRRPGDDSEMYLDRIQRLVGTLDEPARLQRPVARVLADIASDSATRDRFLAAERDAAEGPTRVRMVNLARDLSWLSEEQRVAELKLMLSELQARKTVGVQEIDLACRLNQNRELDGAATSPRGRAESVAHAAVRACLGSAEARATTLDGLASAREADVQAAQAYLRRRPVTSYDELRAVAARIADMPAGSSQVRALDVLGRHYVSDRSVMQTLTELYKSTPSPAVQNAVAGVLLRADRRGVDRAELRRVLTDHRRPAKASGEMVDALLTRLDAPREPVR